jgi:DNA-binding transcriptional LysR family regulator
LTRSYATFVIGTGASLIEWVVLPALSKINIALNGAFLRLEANRTDELVDRVRDGRLDFAVVREDAIPAGLPHQKMMKLVFCLCVPRVLLRGKGTATLTDPLLWGRLPFAAAITGVQFDEELSQAMEGAGVDFQPAVKCQSLLQVRELVARGGHAGILPSVGTTGLGNRRVAVAPFGPLAHYGRSLVLHWNRRQMERRSVSDAVLAEIAAAMCSSHPRTSSPPLSTASIPSSHRGPKPRGQSGF